MPADAEAAYAVERQFNRRQMIGADRDTIYLYYGAADSCVAMVTGSIRALLAWLDSNSSAEKVSGL
jgi:hypothetical protein